MSHEACSPPLSNPEGNAGSRSEAEAAPFLPSAPLVSSLSPQAASSHGPKRS